MFKIIKSKGNLVAIGEYNGKKILMTEERITKGANKMKHTPTAEQIRTLKITMEEEIDRNGDEYEDVNENCRYWLNNINDIVHAVNMHESLVEALKANAIRFPMEFKTTTKDCTCNQFIDSNSCRHVMALIALKNANVYFGD